MRGGWPLAMGRVGTRRDGLAWLAGPGGKEGMWPCPGGRGCGGEWGEHSEPGRAWKHTWHPAPARVARPRRDVIAEESLCLM
jgi:hypothetical protein